MLNGTWINLLLGTLLALVLTACGGSSGGASGGSTSDDGTDPSITPDTGDGDGDGDGRTSVSLKLGTGKGSNFVDQVLQISDELLVAGGQTSILVNVVDVNKDNSLYANSVAISFTSTCAVAGKAEFANAGIVLATGGSASINYKDLGCGVFGGKQDTITASITAIGTEQVSGSATASRTLTIAPPIVNSVAFVGAAPEVLRLNVGNAQAVKSTLQFQVLSKDALPIVSQPVNFSIVTDNGGASLVATQATTNEEGIAEIELVSGSVTGSIIVEAKTEVLNEDGSSKSVADYRYARSNEVIVQSGLPTQTGFLLNVETFNNQTWNLVGSQLQVTARLRDIHNRIVPDGTKVYFMSDKNGRIMDSPCTTVNGSCFVTWESGRADGYNSDGLISITAWAAGEAIEHDTNSNKVWDLGEPFSKFSEPFLDANDDGVYNADTDSYEDLNKDNKFNSADEQSLVYRGAACSDQARKATPVTNSSEKHCDSLATIWKSVQLTNSSGDGAQITVRQGATEVSPGATIALTKETSIEIEVQDENGNIPPMGTEISVKAENGTIVSGDNITAVPNLLRAPGQGFKFKVGLRPDDTASKGDLIIDITTLQGNVERHIYTLDETEGAITTPVNLDVVALTLGKTDLKANETTTVSVNIVNTANGNALHTEDVRVEFSSTCVTLGKAKFSKATVDTRTGKATTSYTDQGCGEIGGKQDTITATLIADGAPSTTVNLNVLPTQVGSLSQDGVSNKILSLSGYATSEKPNTSEINFKLLSKELAAIADREVKFELVGENGGATLAYTSAFTDATGTVTARVIAGRLPGSVKVRAITKLIDATGAEEGELPAYSDLIEIYSRLPMAGNLLLTANVLNPRAYDVSGETVSIEVRAKDRNNYAVDDGTIVHFRTDENGIVDDKCEIKNGKCDVNWTSARTAEGDYKIVIMARTLGEVKFSDANNNNLYDVGETFEALSEAYVDINDNGDYDAGIDDLIDANNDGELTPHNAADDLYRGVACSGAALAAGHCAELAHVWTSVTLINSDGGPGAITLLQDDVVIPLSSRINISGTENFTIEVKDRNGNLPPKNTVVGISLTNGEQVSGPSIQSVPSIFKDQGEGYRFNIAIKEDGTPSDGQLIIELRNLDGSEVRYVYALNDGVSDTDETVEIGVGKLDGGDYTDGEATLAIGNGATLSSNGSTTVTADVVNKSNGNARYTKLSEVVFTSLCAQQGKAEFSPDRLQALGTARSTYRDLGCARDGSSNVSDDIQVLVITKDDQGNTEEVLASATAQIYIAPPEVGTIEFVSATPEAISLKGLGNATTLPELSRVTFRVLDKAGEPMAGRTVNFSLSHPLAGVELTQASVSSDVDGLASVALLSGRTHGTVSIKAELVAALGISTNSSPITVTTGLPTQASMTLAVDMVNPRAWNYSGTSVNVSASVADQYGNWVPDGTSIVFAAEGGSIDDVCMTVQGTCSVEWRSQNPQPVDGIVTIIARTEGVAYFQDLNDNGYLDVSADGASIEPFKTFGEAYLDADDSGDYNPTEEYQAVLDLDGDDKNEFDWDGHGLNDRERFFDFNQNEIMDSATTGADKRYQGVTCTDAAKLAGHCGSRFEVNAQAKIIMSSASEPYIEGPFIWSDALGRFDTTSISACTDVSYGAKKVAWRVADSVERRNKLPAGTGLTFTGDQIKLQEESGVGSVSSLAEIVGAPTRGDAIHKYEYLNDRGHLVWANIQRADEIDSLTGGLSLTVNSVVNETYVSAIDVGVGGDNGPIYEDGVRVTSLDVSEGSAEVTLKLFDACRRGFDAGEKFIIRTSNGELSVDAAFTITSNRLDITLDGSLDDDGFNEVKFHIRGDGEAGILSNALEIYGPNGKIADYQITD